MPPTETAETSRPEYDSALEAVRAATRAFRRAEADYRARKIGDTEYLAARADMQAADRAFDVVRGEAVAS
jgi:outer membrane protein TolC